MDSFAWTIQTCAAENRDIPNSERGNVVLFVHEAIELEKIKFQREIEEKKLKQNEKKIAMDHELKQRELALAEKREQREQLNQDNRIMQLDLTKLDDDSKEYYRLMRKKLIARARAAE